ncbi:MAG: tetratricopeptide repeat protein [Bacteroidia bacterium]
MKSAIPHLLLCLLFSLSTWAQSPEFQAAKLQYDKKNYKEAIKLFSKSVDAKTATQLDYYYRGNAYLELNQAQEAYNDFTASIELAKDFSEAYFMRGILLINPQQVQEALNDLNMAIKYAKNDTIRVMAYSNRAGAKLYTQNYESAVKDCMEALKIDSTSIRSRAAYVNLSTCYGYQKKGDQSIKILKKIYALDSSDVPVIGNLGFELSVAGKYEESIYYFNRALKLKPDEAFILSNKSFSCMKLGRLDEATQLIDKSVKHNPDNSYAYKNMGLIYLEKKDKTKACESFDMALKKGFLEMYGNEVSDLIKANCK